MNNHIITIAGATTPPDSQLRPSCSSPDPHHIFRPTVHISDHQNPRKKRTKMIRLHNPNPIIAGASGSHSGIVTKKKPDPSAPKITRPCTECGKRFWSWKALFGHMRCHPERPWRGINPPPNIHHHPPPPAHRDFTEEDEYVAACLLMLANTNTPTTHCNPPDTFPIPINDPDRETRFECASCKKVFGSHQALGGHRASHKNVKGCFAITRNDTGSTEELEYGYGDHYTSEGLNINHQQHKCSICSKIFASGQALGGHKRCHLEKEDSAVTVVPTASTSVLSQPFRFDLNTPAPLQDDSTCSSSDLDLRLHL